MNLEVSVYRSPVANSAMDIKSASFSSIPIDYESIPFSWKVNDFPRRRGVAIALVLRVLENPFSSFWCLSTTSNGVGDK